MKGSAKQIAWATDILNKVEAAIGGKIEWLNRKIADGKGTEKTKAAVDMWNRRLDANRNVENASGLINAWGNVVTRYNSPEQNALLIVDYYRTFGEDKINEWLSK